MKKLIVVFLGIAMILMACSDKQESVKLEAGTPEYELAQKIAAKVPSLNPDENIVVVKADDFDVTSGEVIKVLYSRIGNNEARLINQSEEQLKQIVMQNAERIAEQKLLVIAAEKAGYAVSDSELDSTLDQRYQRFGGIDKYKERLESSGIKFETMREDMREGLMIRNYLEQDVAATDNVSDEELQKYFDEQYTGDRTATVQHILFMTQGKSAADKEEVRKKAEEVLEEAKGGKDFGKLAQQYSEDPGSKDRGGLYENFERGQMVKPFEDASFNLPIGSISDLVETQYGYHIIKVVSREQGNETLEQVRPKLLEQMKRQKIDDYIKEVRESAGIEIVGLG
jgi:parvulin-like peptidyl-prolyl isomerase